MIFDDIWFCIWFYIYLMILKDLMHVAILKMSHVETWTLRLGACLGGESLWGRTDGEANPGNPQVE